MSGNKLLACLFFFIHRKQGFFYYDEYIGNEPGDLFAATTCTCTCLGRGSSAEPLMSDEEKRYNFSVSHDHSLAYSCFFLTHYS